VDRTSADLLFVCLAWDVPVGAAIRIEVGEFVLAVFNLDGTIFVIDDACTHGPGSLSEGYIEDDIVECNFHRGAFNIRTGSVVSPPCTVPMRTYAVVISRALSTSIPIGHDHPRASGGPFLASSAICKFGETR
jgi:nitrite reductase/ring-hydroxylating ferredoxin subunit